MFSLMQVHMSATISTIPDAKHQSSVNAAQNVVRLLTFTIHSHMK